MTVQQVPDEWKGSARITTPAVDNTGHNGCAPPPVLNFEDGYPRAVSHTATRAGFSARRVPNFRASTTSILRALTSPLFGALTARFFGALTGSVLNRPKF